MIRLTYFALGLFVIASIIGCSEPIGYTKTNDQLTGSASAIGTKAKSKITITR